MKLDRHELHVIREMESLGFHGAKKLISLSNAHRISTTYNVRQNRRQTECQIILDGIMAYSGMSFASQKESKISDAVGRMIAFAYAIAFFCLKNDYPFFGQDDLPENWAEMVARGEFRNGERKNQAS